MKTSFKLAILIGIAAIAVLSSCSDKPKVKAEPDFDYGSVDSMVYTNRFFGLKMKIPKGWHVKSRKELDSLSEPRAGIYVDAILRMPTKRYQVKYAELCLAHRDTGSTVKMDYLGNPELNPFVVIELENPDTLKGAKDIKRFVALALNDMDVFPGRYTVIDTGEVTVSGRKMYRLHVRTNDFKDFFNPCYLDYYIGLVNNFYIAITIAHMKTDVGANADKIIKGLTFTDADTTGK